LRRPEQYHPANNDYIVVILVEAWDWHLDDDDIDNDQNFTFPEALSFREDPLISVGAGSKPLNRQKSMVLQSVPIHVYELRLSFKIW
jgi:hypothetical protein